MAKKGQHTLHVEGIPQELARALKIQAAVEGRSIKSLIIEMIEERTGYKKDKKGGKKDGRRKEKD